MDLRAPLLALLVSAGAWLFPAAARAGEEVPGIPDGETGEARNELAVFLGGTDVDDRIRPTLGVDYERRLTPHLGAGVVADWVFTGDGREFLLAPAAFYRPVPELRLVLAAGLQRDREEREVEAIMRFGVDYAFELNERWGIAPGISVDLVGGEVITVAGIAATYRF